MRGPYLLQCDKSTGGCGTTFPGDMLSCPKCGCGSWLCMDASLLINPLDYALDIETYPDTFTCAITHISTNTRWKFEISPRLNQINEFIAFIFKLRDIGARGVGFNNELFDYPVIHYICINPFVTWVEIYNKAMDIIKGNNKYAHFVWERDRIFEQLDLFKIHHYDNTAKSTSLKALEFAMRMRNIEDLPFEVGSTLNDDQRDVLHRYNAHDVDATSRFYIRSLSEIKLRESLSQKYGVNMLNFSDSKIGSAILINELEKVGIQCYDKSTGRKQPRQTVRASINLGEVIFPYVKFERPEFERVRAHLASMTIHETKGVFDELHAVVDGLEYHFGTGGLHAAIPNSIFEADDEYAIEMRDVVSYYPSMSIVNKVYPKHLGERFCDVYNDLFKQRRSFPKGTPENAALKIALNGSYGNSNNKYSPLYDPKFTMTITINGQLMLAMLSEQLIKIPRLKMINVNTDGVGFIYPKKYRPNVDAVCEWWGKVTGLELETDEYTKFCQRDVNSYIGVQI